MDLLGCGPGALVLHTRLLAPRTLGIGRCRRRGRVLVNALSSALVGLIACGTPRFPGSAPIVFDTATAWIQIGSDSTRLLVEIAASRRQHELGLSGRPSLDPESGMLFLFDEGRSGEDGFWMLGTRIPLDIAFIDDAGVIRRILSMEACVEPDPGQDCPSYFPGVRYTSALEANRGWFAAKEVEVGAWLRVVR